MTRALLGVALGAAVMTVVPASAAPPSAPEYQCATQAGPSDPDTATRIMIAGDSITNASAGDYTWPYWLWQDLKPANVDFVGRFSDTIDANTYVQGSHAYLDCDFDQDRETRPGVKLYTDPAKLYSGTYGLDTPAKVYNNPLYPYYGGADDTSWIKGATSKYMPDLLVIVAGANDLFNSEAPAGSSDSQVAAFVISKLKDVIAQARAGNPGVDIVLTTVPSSSAGSRYNLYNEALPGVVSGDTSPDGSHLTLATLPSWSNHTWDGEHPDAVGEVSIAAVVAHALHVLDPSLPDTPAQLQTPAIGPAFPAVLTASTAGNNKVDLSWTLPPGADRSIIWMRQVGAGSWTQKADLVKATLPVALRGPSSTVCDTPVPGDSTGHFRLPCSTYSVTGLAPGAWEFKVQLGKGHAVAPESAVPPTAKQVTVTGSVVLGKVATPTATTGVHAVKVTWPAMAGATSYDVRWHAVGSATYGTTTAPTATRTITGLVAGRKYGFQVRARNAGPAGAWSAERQAVPKANALARAKKPVLRKVAGVRIKATWGSSAGARAYQVQRRIAGGAWKVVATTARRSLVSGRLVKGKTYYFRIRPYDGLIGGAYSPTTKRKAS